MSAKTVKWRKFKEPAPSLVPPDIEKFGSLGFLSSDRSSLSKWLNESDWPRDTMNVVAIEGYLVAMIVWPINLSPGAWLPAIWGIRGWKVAAKIEAPASYDRFLRLILGYRQHLTAVLTSAPQTFVPALHDSIALSSAGIAAMRWAQGFMAALQQGTQGLDLRSAQSIAAVKLIALHASSVAPYSHKSESVLAAEIGKAVLTIVSDIPAGTRKSAA
ncbi:MAG: YecA family protein [Pseudomonadota bacterium]|nr:YecA family protein [Pseudomonadota bacterium]